jgi:hypothetical protein
MDKHRLGKENIHDMLKSRTNTLVERIDRNIRIGMFILLGFIVYIIADDLYFSKILITAPIEYPSWLVPIDVFSNALIVTTYLFFVLRYLRIKRSFSADTQLKDLLSGILETLKTYRRMFYLAVIILMINIIISFTAGIYQGVKFKTDTTSGEIIDLSFGKIMRIIAFGLAVLIPLVSLTFFLLHRGFRNLYGRYLIKLNETLQELDESESGE